MFYDFSLCNYIKVYWTSRKGLRHVYNIVSKKRPRLGVLVWHYESCFMKRGSEREIIIYAGRSMAWHLEETALPRGRDMLIALRTSREARTCNRLLVLCRHCIARTRNPARRLCVRRNSQCVQSLSRL